MKRSKLLILIFVFLAGAAAVIYYMYRYKTSQEISNKIIMMQKNTVVKLEEQTRQLKEMLSVMEKEGLVGTRLVGQKHSISLREKLKKAIAQNKVLARKVMLIQGGRENALQLEKNLNQAMAQNQALSEELLVLKERMELARPLEERINRVGNALVIVSTKRGKQKQMKMQLESLVDELKAINTNIAQLFGLENASGNKYGILSDPLSVVDIRQAPSAVYPAGDQTAPLVEAGNYSALKSEMAGMQEIIKNNQSDLSGRAEKILTLQEKLAEFEKRFAEMQGKYQEMIKDSAVLREQYVYIQLEREGLIAELNQTKSKLNELQTKLGQIGNIFGPVGQFEAPKGNIPTSKKIDVELLPEVAAGGKR